MSIDLIQRYEEVAKEILGNLVSSDVAHSISAFAGQYAAPQASRAALIQTMGVMYLENVTDQQAAVRNLGDKISGDLVNETPEILRYLELARGGAMHHLDNAAWKIGTIFIAAVSKRAHQMIPA